MWNLLCDLLPLILPLHMSFQASGSTCERDVCYISAIIPVAAPPVWIQELALLNVKNRSTDRQNRSITSVMTGLKNLQWKGAAISSLLSTWSGWKWILEARFQEQLPPSTCHVPSGPNDFLALFKSLPQHPSRSKLVRDRPTSFSCKQLSFLVQNYYCLV